MYVTVRFLCTGHTVDAYIRRFLALTIHPHTLFHCTLLGTSEREAGGGPRLVALNAAEAALKRPVSKCDGLHWNYIVFGGNGVCDVSVETKRIGYFLNLLFFHWFQRTHARLL
jgi:hypothetical protein